MENAETTYSGLILHAEFDFDTHLAQFRINMIKPPKGWNLLRKKRKNMEIMHPCIKFIVLYHFLFNFIDFSRSYHDFFAFLRVPNHCKIHENRTFC